MSNDIKAIKPGMVDESQISADLKSNDSMDRLEGELYTIALPGVDAVFEEHAALINHSIQSIGMGKYQWHLFIMCGFGWMIDQVRSSSLDLHSSAENCYQLWQTAIAGSLASVGREFAPEYNSLLTLALKAGLVVGATFWGIGSDIIGRRLAFNVTLFIAGAFGLAIGAAPNFTACAVMAGLIGFGIGGNRE